MLRSSQNQSKTEICLLHWIMHIIKTNINDQTKHHYPLHALWSLKSNLTAKWIGVSVSKKQSPWVWDRDCVMIRDRVSWCSSVMMSPWSPVSEPGCLGPACDQGDQPPVTGCTLSLSGLTSLCPRRDIWPAAAAWPAWQAWRTAERPEGGVSGERLGLGSVLRLPRARPQLASLTSELQPSWVLSLSASGGLWWPRHRLVTGDL